MTKEDENLVLLDLCGRLPFGVKAKVTTLYDYYDLLDSSKDKVIEQTEEVEFTFDNFSEIVRKSSDIVLYLRPLSSMTKKEKEGMLSKSHYDEKYTNDGMDCVYQHTIADEYAGVINIQNIETSIIDWLNQHHFDYRGLIEKGLALVAPENMYN